MTNSWSHGASPRAILALLAAAGAVAPGAAAAQSANIDTAQPFYVTSALGATVNPDFRGGVLRVDQAGGHGESFTLDGSGTNTIDLNGLSSSFNGVFSDATGGVPGTLRFVNGVSGGAISLNGVNTYTGATTIGDGVALSLTSGASIADSSVVNLAGVTSSFDVSNAGSGVQIKALSGVAGSRVVLGAKGLTVNHASAATFAGEITGGGTDAFIKAGSGIQTLSGVNTYTNATNISAGTLALSGAGSIATSSSVDVATGATFDISATTAGAAVARLTGAGAVILGGRTLTLTGASNDTFSGGLSGAGGGLTIASGSQTLTGAGSYTGLTTIASGATLILSGAGSIAGTSGVLVNGTFDISATSAGATTGSLSGGGHVVLGGQSLTVSQGSGSFSGDIAGAGGLVVTGGVQVLSGLNTYTGGTTISGGTLRLSGSGTLGAASGDLTIAGGTLDLGGSSQTVGSFTLAGGALRNGVLDAPGFGILSGEIQAELTGSGALTKTGSGTAVLSGANSYQGGTSIADGLLALTGAGTLGAATGALSLSGGALDLGGTRQTTGALTMTGGVIVDRTGGGVLSAQAFNLQAGAISAVLGGSGALTQSGSGASVLLAANRYTGATTISGGALALAGSGSIAASSRVAVATGALFDISNATAGGAITTLSGAGVVNLGGQTLTLTGAHDAFSGLIGGAGGLTVAAGEQTLSGANTYTGVTGVQRGASLVLTGGGGVAASSGVTVDGVLDIAGTTSGAAITTLAGSGDVRLGDKTLVVMRASGLFTGAISGSGAVVVTGGGAALGGVSSYTGGTGVKNATLRVSDDAALGGARGGVALDNGALVIQRDMASARPIWVMAGGGAIDADHVSVALDGPIGLSGVLSVGGGGTVSFTNVARGDGAVALTSGLFANNGEISAAALTVGRDATLRGVGLVNAPTRVSGVLAPGNSPGTLTFAGAVTLDASATTAFDIDGTGAGAGAGNYSRIVVGGPDGRLTAAGVIAPRLRGITGLASNTFSPAIGQQFQVITTSGGIAATSSFSALAQPVGLLAGTRFDALYATNTLTLAVTPAAYADLRAAGLAPTPNQTAVGASLDAARPAAGLRLTADAASVFYPLYRLSAAEVPAALDALSPDIYADGVVAVRQAWRQGADAVSGQLADRRGTAADEVTVWGDALGQTTTFGPLGQDAKARAGGLIFGVDRAFAGGVAGAALALDSLRTTAPGGDKAIGDLMVQAAVYGSLHHGAAFVDWQGDYARMSQDVTRAGGPFGGVAKAKTTLKGGGVQVHAGVDVALAGWRVAPTVGLSAVRVTSSAAVEASSGVTAEAIASSHTDSLQSFAGIRLARSVRLASGLPAELHGLAGWTHELEDVDAEARARLLKLGGPDFTVSSAPAGRDAAKLGAGFSAQMTPNITLHGAYAAELGRDRTSQQVLVGARVRW